MCVCVSVHKCILIGTSSTVTSVRSCINLQLLQIASAGAVSDCWQKLLPWTIVNLTPINFQAMHRFPNNFAKYDKLWAMNGSRNDGSSESSTFTGYIHFHEKTTKLQKCVQQTRIQIIDQHWNDFLRNLYSFGWPSCSSLILSAMNSLSCSLGSPQSNSKSLWLLSHFSQKNPSKEFWNQEIYGCFRK